MSASADQSTVNEKRPDESTDSSRFFGRQTPPVHIQFGALSHCGSVRTNNEDHFSVVRRRRSREVLLTNLPEHAIPNSLHDDAFTMVVADGIGGAAFGELASIIALQTSWDLTSHAFKWHFQMNEVEAEEVKEMLALYGQLIHQRLRDEAASDPRLTGMGTTITGALTIGFDAFIAHVGDSRAYLFRDGMLEQLTKDHTVAQKLVDAGAIASVTDVSRRMRNMLANCLGGYHRSVDVEVNQVHLSDGDQLLLCTDGLTDMVADAEIARTLRADHEPQDACQALVQQALEQGGRDNVTVIVARYARPPKSAE